MQKSEAAALPDSNTSAAADVKLPVTRGTDPASIAKALKVPVEQILGSRVDGDQVIVVVQDETTVTKRVCELAAK